MFVEEGGTKRQIEKMSVPQTRQAAAIVDCIGRLIPQEGIDYDVDVIFKGGEYNPSVSMAISPLTDKGERWRSYVMEMINKYPPKVEDPEQAIEGIDEELANEAKEAEQKTEDQPEEGVVDAEVVS